MIYIYIDDQFAFKSLVRNPAEKTLLDLEVEILLPLESNKVIIEVYDCADHEPSRVEDDEDDDDEDKVIYTEVGKIEIKIDKIF